MVPRLFHSSFAANDLSARQNDLAMGQQQQLEATVVQRKQLLPYQFLSLSLP